MRPLSLISDQSRPRDPVADQHYQDYHVALLKRLAGQYPEEPLFRRLYLRWRRCA